MPVTASRARARHRSSAPGRHNCGFFYYCCFYLWKRVRGKGSQLGGGGAEISGNSSLRCCCVALMSRCLVLGEPACCSRALGQGANADEERYLQFKASRGFGVVAGGLQAAPPGPLKLGAEKLLCSSLSSVLAFPVTDPSIWGGGGSVYRALAPHTSSARRWPSIPPRAASFNTKASCKWGCEATRQTGCRRPSHYRELVRARVPSLRLWRAARIRPHYAVTHTL